MNYDELSETIFQISAAGNIHPHNVLVIINRLFYPEGGMEYNEFVNNMLNAIFSKRHTVPWYIPKPTFSS